MDTKFCKPQRGVSSLILSILLVMSSSSLLGCEQQPQSMFEQQASANSGDDSLGSVNSDSDRSGNGIKKVENDIGSVSSTAATVTPNTISNPALHASKQQAIAQQPNCNPLQTSCQYLKLSFLEFTPEQPWLNSIMWQTIARMLAPGMPLASQDESAKKTVLMLLNQIEYSEQVVSSLPMYQLIDIELVLNSPTKKILKNSQVDKLKIATENEPSNNIGYDSIATGYLVVRSKQHRSASRQQLTYVMLDIEKKLQLTIEDILLPKMGTDDVLLAFQSSKKEWLTLQGIEQKYHEDWPLYPSSQWYLDEQGLHMVYQTGELLTAKTGSVDLIAPYNLLQGLIKPRYIVH